MRHHEPVPPVVDDATPLAQSRMARLYDALCHAPSGGLDTRALSDRTGIAHRTAYGLLKRLEDNELVWSVLMNQPAERRTGPRGRCGPPRSPRSCGGSILRTRPPATARRRTWRWRAHAATWPPQACSGRSRRVE